MMFPFPTTFVSEYKVSYTLQTKSKTLEKLLLQYTINNNNTYDLYYHIVAGGHWTGRGRWSTIFYAQCVCRAVERRSLESK